MGASQGLNGVSERSASAVTAEKGHVFHPTILREYDIRGIVGETLFLEDARAIGRAFGTIVRRDGGKRVGVGFDGRLSSPDLEAAIVEGLRASGIDVLRIGRGPTPMLYFAVHHLEVDAGIQITGSHNPPSHNGFKMMLGRSSFFGDGIKEIGRIAAAGAFAGGSGSLTEAPVADAYVERLLADARFARPVHAIWDAGNGATGEVLKAVAARLPGRHRCLFADIDGQFPNHHPDPTIPENLAQLTDAVRADGAEIGIAFDGDGDRIGVIDGQGEIMWGDQILQILAEEVLARRPGETIIADVKASQTLFDRIAALGGTPLMWKTGHSLIKAAMAERGSPLAGEMSGHIFYKDGFYGHDDALYVAIRLLNILASDSRTLADRRAAIPPTLNTPELRFDCPDEEKFAVVERVKTQLKAAGVEVNDIDGVRITTPDGWWLLRASNTQAVLVARAEARDADGLARLKQTLRDQLAAAGVAPPSI